MTQVDRRSALAIGLAAASAAMAKPAAAQTTDYKDVTVAPGVVNRVYGEGPSIIPASRLSRCVTSSFNRVRRLPKIK